MKIMVVGASGALGKLVCIEPLRIFENQTNLIVTNYKAERGNELASSFGSEVPRKTGTFLFTVNAKKAKGSVSFKIAK